jgi:hypothetical protein
MDAALQQGMNSEQTLRKTCSTYVKMRSQQKDDAPFWHRDAALRWSLQLSGRPIQAAARAKSRTQSAVKATRAPFLQASLSARAQGSNSDRSSVIEPDVALLVKHNTIAGLTPRSEPRKKFVCEAAVAFAPAGQRSKKA